MRFPVACIVGGLGDSCGMAGLDRPAYDLVGRLTFGDCREYAVPSASPRSRITTHEFLPAVRYSKSFDVGRNEVASFLAVGWCLLTALTPSEQEAGRWFSIGWPDSSGAVVIPTKT